MQIKSLRIKSYRSWRIDDRYYSVIVRKKLERLKKFDTLIAEGCREAMVLEVLDISRSTLYRDKRALKQFGLPGLETKSQRPKNTRKPIYSRELENLVLKLRNQEPSWGKIKIHKLLIRDHGIDVSLATVGRIISRFLAKKKIQTAYLAANKNKPKRRRIFNKHATRWKYGMKAENPGEMIQIDHMSVYCNSSCIKHFKAVCPVTRYMVCEVYTTASSTTASKFLTKVIEDMPFKVSSIQVDGGSEFMKHFEALCQELNLKLLVLPPRSPKYNGKVERCNGITREEFYSRYTDVFDITTIKPHLSKYQDKYNTYRPHQALNNLTPMEYIGLKYQNMAA